VRRRAVDSEDAPGPATASAGETGDDRLSRRTARPGTLPLTRLPFERHIFQVVAAVTLVRFEADDDYHLVLSDGRRTMIAESPMPECARRATRLRRRQMAHARAALRRCTKAVVTGVAFFDFPHGQSGVAPNAIELHPILAFHCLPNPP